MVTRWIWPVGRLGRGGFWLGLLVLIGLWFALSYGLNLLEPHNVSPGGSRNLPAAPGSLASYAGLPLLWPWFCIYATRMHDKGHSAWRLLIPVVLNVLLVAGLFALIVLGFSPVATNDLSHFAGIWLLAIATSGSIFLFDLGYLLWIGLTPGDAGNNPYGPGKAAK